MRRQWPSMRIARPRCDVVPGPGSDRGHRSRSSRSSGAGSRTLVENAAVRERSSSELQLDGLELQFALGLLPDGEGGSGGGAEALEGLTRMGIVDFQGLRREVNRRLVPEKHLNAMFEAARREGRQVGPTPVQQANALLPRDEEGLLALAERLLDLEVLRDVLRCQFSGDELRSVYRELLEGNIGSLKDLLWASPGIVVRGGPKMVMTIAEAKRRVADAADDGGDLSRRCELVRFGAKPILVTAPHNIFLRRDGHPPHTLEEYTAWIAQRLAREISGSSLCWTREAQWRSETRYALGQRRKAAGVADGIEKELDPLNRDPNFLLPEELPKNHWFVKMQGWVGERQQQGVMLHIDLHGCQDPPKHPAHAMLGLGAMRQHAEALPEDSPERELWLGRMHAFAEGLKGPVSEVLASILDSAAKRGTSPMVTPNWATVGAAATVTGLNAAVNEAGEYVETLSGAWPPFLNRYTQTQQSISVAGMSHAVQLEMSRTLRQVLVASSDGIAMLAHTIHAAWREALRAEPTAV